MRSLAILVTLALALAATFGIVRAIAQEASPVGDADATTMTLVERADNVSTVDLGAPGPTPGDLLVWGPNPLFDEANTTDTGATTAGSCLTLNTADDHQCFETIVFPDGSTLTIQGVQLAGGALSPTITGGSSQYLGATGTLLVDAFDDLSTWTKTFEIVLER